MSGAPRASARRPGAERWIGLAPAKVNLGLRVLARRDDGFHEVRTRLLALDLCDRLELARTTESGVRLEIEGPCAAGVPAGAENLAARAVRAVAELGGDRSSGGGVRVRLEKRVPREAGLGGGSADAACALLGAAALAGLAPYDARLVEAASALGSDVAFFVAARASGFAVCEGRGERCTPLEPAPRSGWVGLATPTCTASTAAVYARCVPSGVSEPFDTVPSSLEALRHELSNDLEPAALEAVPELRAWRSTLDDAGLAHWRLTGSGSTFYAVFDDGGRGADELARVRALAQEDALGGLRLAALARPAGHAVRELWRAGGADA